MIVGERILNISGKREKREQIQGLSINISIEKVDVKGEDVEIEYLYTANYEKDVGQLQIRGVLIAKEEKKLAKELDEEWKKGKKIPESYTPVTLSAINYSGSANGTLLARVLGLTAPLIPPRIQIAKKE
ncbi:hypothetical protein H0O02_05130 [Candidatus Micrarchaeota archaeon]|nr:hypothetical protein [Candidatus Micrarchaeota archaeon]